MTTTQIRILECVRQGFNSRKSIAEKTGMVKGFAKAMGAVTKGKPGKGTLVGDGLLKATKGEEGWEYELTAKGKGLLSKESRDDIKGSLTVREVNRKPAKAKAKAKGKGKAKKAKAKAKKAKATEATAA